LDLARAAIVHHPTEPLAAVAQHLAGSLGQHPQPTLTSGSAGRDPRIALALLDRPAPELGTEGYCLDIDVHGVRIAANQPAGCFYGVQTLLQLLPPPPFGGRVPLPCLHIEDRPRFAWRGLLLDVSRHFFTKAEVMEYMDQMAACKLNILHLHLTDDQGWRIEIAGAPELTAIGAWRVPRQGDWWSFDPPQPGEAATYGGYYTRADVSELVAYARSRHITLVPEVDVPGHSLALLAAHPELSCLGGPFQVNPGSKFYTEIENAVCPGKEATFARLEQVFGQVAAAFPGPFIHIGGDEAYKGFWARCPDCRVRMAREGLATVEELQSYFVRRLERLVNANGKRLIGWDEISEGGLAPHATVMSWRGVAGGVAAAQAGHDVVMTPSPACYLDLYQGDSVGEPMTYSLARLSHTYAFEPVPPDVAPERILGVQGNVWTESIADFRHLQYMTWPRGWAIAESGWSQPDDKEWTGFSQRVEAHFRRADARDQKYAPSMFDAAFAATLADGGEMTIRLSTEIEGLSIHYSFDNAIPDPHYPQCTAPLKVPRNASTLKVVTCRDGQIIGRQMSMPIAELRRRAAG
jgi:hexosaminidase